MKRLSRLYLVGLLMLIIALSGCIIGDEKYATSEEEYEIGWILHNVNESTPTELTFDSRDLAMYTYTFNYPGTQPNEMHNILFWIQPIHKNENVLQITFHNKIATPLNRTYYVMGEEPPQGYYVTNWSFCNLMVTNYLPFEYYGSFEEHYECDNPFEGIKPISGDKRQVYFGTLPFLPTYILVESNTLRLGRPLIKGYQDTSQLVGYTSLLSLDEIPKYQIFLNGSLKLEGNLTHQEEWNHTVLNYDLGEENGDYVVKVMIPTSYPTWNVVEITGKFKKPSADMQPPILNGIEARPYFEINKDYSLSLNLSDNTRIDVVGIEYNTTQGWFKTNVTNTSEIYTTTFNINDQNAKEFSLRISVNDSYGNEISYTITPFALLGREIHLNLTSSTNTFVPLQNISFGGSVSDGKNYVRGLKLMHFINDEYFDSEMSGFDFSDREGEFKTSWTVPANYSQSILKITSMFRGTGCYLPKAESIILSYQTPQPTTTTSRAGGGYTGSASISMKTSTTVTTTTVQKDEVQQEIKTPRVNASNFIINNLIIEKRNISPGEPIIIKVNVSNIGDIEGNYTLYLKINGIIEGEKTITLKGGESTIVTFEVTKGNPNVYEVEVGDLKESFVVAKKTSLTKDSLKYILIGIVFIIFAFAVIAIFATKTRQKEERFLLTDIRFITKFNESYNGKRVLFKGNVQFINSEKGGYWYRIFDGLNEVYGFCEKAIDDGQYKIMGLVRNEDCIYVVIENFEKV